jgi:hypothetical protein
MTTSRSDGAYPRSRRAGVRVRALAQGTATGSTTPAEGASSWADAPSPVEPAYWGEAAPGPSEWAEQRAQQWPDVGEQ